MIYWELNKQQHGFVSYDNGSWDTQRTEKAKARQQYQPVELQDATLYLSREDAKLTLDWYVGRGGFGFFKIVQIDL